MTVQFWMVVGEGPTSFRHHSKASAETEARRLARENPGIKFIVMEAVSAHMKIDVQSWPLAPRASLDDELPF